MSATKHFSYVCETIPEFWDRLSAGIKLILVKELAAWYTFEDVVALLQLTDAQHSAFVRLYRGQLAKQSAYDKVIRAKIKERDEYLFSYVPYTSLDKPGPSLANYEAARRAQNPRIPPLELATDYITIQDMKLGEEYLVAVGFDRDWVDLGHWVGHSGTSRFVIDIDLVGHYERDCSSGTQNLGILRRQRPVIPGQELDAVAQQLAQAKKKAEKEAKERDHRHAVQISRAYAHLYAQARVEDFAAARAAAARLGLPMGQLSSTSLSPRRSSVQSGRGTRHRRVMPASMDGQQDDEPTLSAMPAMPHRRSTTLKRGRGRPRIHPVVASTKRRKTSETHSQEPRSSEREESVPVASNSPPDNSELDGEYELE